MVIIYSTYVLYVLAPLISVVIFQFAKCTVLKLPEAFGSNNLTNILLTFHS